MVSLSIAAPQIMFWVRLLYAIMDSLAPPSQHVKFSPDALQALNFLPEAIDSFNGADFADQIPDAVLIVDTGEEGTGGWQLNAN